MLVMPRESGAFQAAAPDLSLGFAKYWIVRIRG